MSENNGLQPDEATGLVTLNDDQRFQVLMAQLAERYAAWHHMRARSMQFTLWILGLAVAVSWKLLQEPWSDLYQRTAATLLVLMLGGASLYFLTSLARGVRKNREALINIETALGNHRSGAYLRAKAVLPAEYMDTKPRASSHFRTLYVLLTVTSVYLIAAIWSPVCCDAPDRGNTPRTSGHGLQSTDLARDSGPKTGTTVYEPKKESTP